MACMSKARMTAETRRARTEQTIRVPSALLCDANSKGHLSGSWGRHDLAQGQQLQEHCGAEPV